jgi:hypothetical protein
MGTENWIVPPVRRGMRMPGLTLMLSDWELSSVLAVGSSALE